MASPLDEFKIKSIVNFQVGGIDVSFTNFSLWMVISVIAIIVFLIVAGAGRPDGRPGRLRSLAELAYNFVAGLF